MKEMAETTTEDVYDDAYEEKPGPSPPMKIVWRNVILMSLLHLGALYGLTILPSVSTLTLLWSEYVTANSELTDVCFNRNLFMCLLRFYFYGLIFMYKETG